MNVPGIQGIHFSYTENSTTVGRCTLMDHEYTTVTMYIAYMTYMICVCMCVYNINIQEAMKKLAFGMINIAPT